MQFDKDDDVAMEFVVAAANLRSLCYDIPTQSFFEAKGMAGNIIHAIATTNAIISGLIVVEALKLLAGNRDPAACRATFLRQDLSNRKLVTPTTLEPPNKACGVCSANRLQVRIDTGAATLRDFVDKVLKGHMGLKEPTLTFGPSTSVFTYEEGEDLDPEDVEINAAHLPKLLIELPAGGIVHNTVLEVGDQKREGLKLHVAVCHQEVWDEKVYPRKFAVEGEVPAATAEETAAAEASVEAEEAVAVAAAAVVTGRKGPATIEDADGAFMLVDSEDEGPAVASKKRKLGSGEENGDATKRAKTENGGGDDLEIIELLD